jgi:hypothetical protein
MMAIAFLGYVNSPKWINGNIFYVIFLIIGHYNIKILIRKIKARNSIKSTRYNKLNKKINILFK